MRVPIVQKHYTRRSLLWSAGATVLLPVFPRVTWPPSTTFGSELPSLDTIAARFVNQGHPSLFTAQAAPWMLLYRILGAGGALALILNYLNVRPSWARGVDYSQARACEGNFRNAEGAMRSRGLREFAGVYRPTLEPRFAILAAKSQSGRGEAMTQFEGADALPVGTGDLDPWAVAGEFVTANYRIPGPELTRFAALTRIEEGVGEESDRSVQVPLRVFHNAANGWVMFDRRPFPPATAGRIMVWLPGRTNPRNLPVVGLVA